MELIEEGGLVMWPLLALSVLIVAVIVDRFLVFTTLPLFDAETENRLVAAARGEKVEETLAEAGEKSPPLKPLVEILLGRDERSVREGKAAIAIEEVVRGLDKRVGFLGLASRVAPLLGLLGTVIGMIETFSRLASASGAIDMTLLADGIWQALLTTAAGLLIAIPAVIAQGGFQRREEQVSFALTRLANRIFLGQAGKAAGQVS